MNEKDELLREVKWEYKMKMVYNFNKITGVIFKNI